MKNSIFSFTCDKRDKIKRDASLGKKGNCGIGLVNIELKLKASWAKRLIDKSNNIVNGS